MVNAFISKLTANGEFITAGKLSTDLEMESNAMVVNNEERLWVAGAFGGSGDFDPGPGEFILQAAGEEDAFLLNIEPCTPTASILDIAACEFYTSPSGNATWTISGTYNDTIINVSGCDSVLTINLTIHHSTESEITVEACDEYMTAGGNFLTASGIYTEVVTNVNGCDSVIVINLTILESTIFAQDVTTCTGYISPGGEMYTETGTYYDTLTSSIECDSIIVTYLTIDTINTAVIYPIEGPILLAEQTNANYQWLDCNNNYQPIPGATEQSFTASENGSYAVIISFNDCIDTSACYVVSVGTHDLFEKEGLKLYPNPVQEKVTIEMTEEFKYGSLSIVDLHGREVYKIASVSDSEWQLHLDLVAGIYFVRVRSDGRYAVAKLIISY
jgi:hypothetical protein